MLLCREEIEKVMFVLMIHAEREIPTIFFGDLNLQGSLAFLRYRLITGLTNESCSDLARKTVAEPSS